MFSQELPAILKTLDLARAPVPRADLDAAAPSRHLKSPPLSERMENPAAYRLLQEKRRRDLEALVLSRSPAAPARALDLICAISEESSWAADAEMPFEDADRPSIDLQAADTAALFGWTLRALGGQLDRIGPGIRERMAHEVDRRVLGPLLSHDDYICSVAALCSAATALLFLERDPDRLSASLRVLLRMLDATYACAEALLEPLPDRLRDATAIADFALMMKRLTAGAADLTRDVPYASWLDELLFSHIYDEWFVNCAGPSLRPGLSGQALFRLGRLAGDGALRSLGASLHRARAIPSPTVAGRLFDPRHLDALEAELSPAPRLKNAALEDGRVLVARGAGFALSLTSGGNRGNVGDIAVFLDNVPVLTSGNLPLPQLQKPAFAPAPDWDFSEPDRAIMGVDVTPAYPAEMRVRAHQRTLVLSRQEYGAQLVDVFDLAQPRDIRYQLHTPFRPEFFEGGARLGPMLVRWEGRPEADARRLDPDADFPDGQWELALLYPGASQRAMYTFFMRHA
ncbi:MAG: hypothetical protein GX647_10235 [Clostridiales bacterium]|jgi:hypothetical protein|nr:hypothetical protein [Clostridiales bacterium]